MAWNGSELALASGVISNGETIPLPTFGDGATAAEEMCVWFAIPTSWTDGWGNSPSVAVSGRVVQTEYCSALYVIIGHRHVI